MSTRIAAVTSAPPSLPPIRRVVTGHSASGDSIILDDDRVPSVPVGKRRETQFAGLFWTDEFLCDNGVGEVRDKAREHPFFVHSENGSSVRVTEFPPGGTPSVSTC